MLVSELMSGEPAIVSAEATLQDVGAEMVRLRIRHMPVVDGAGRLAGLVTDHSVFRHGGFLDGDQGWVSYEPAYDGYTAGRIAVQVEVVVGPDEELTVALRKLAATRQDCVVVVDADQHPVGVMTEHDAVRVALDVLDAGLLGEHEASAPVLTIDRDQPAARALDLMVRQQVRHLVVTHPDGTIYGVISYGDLVADDAARRPELHAEDVVRSLQVRTGTEGMTLHELATIMKQDAIGCVPIIDDEALPVAIVTRRDILEAAVAGLESDALFD